MRILRPYQVSIIDTVTERARAGVKRILIQAPTGAGKGVLFEELIRRAVAKSRCVLFVSHRRELNEQISRMLDRHDINHGMMPGWRKRPELPVQVASIQTLARAKEVPKAHLILIDEAHHVAAGQYQSFLGRYPDAILIGNSATPERLDGKGLGDVFQELVCGPSSAELVEQGFLLPLRIYAPSSPDLTGVKKSHGDYNQKQLGEAVARDPSRISDIPLHYIEKGEGLRGITFCVNIEDSKAVAHSYCEQGIPAEHVDGTMASGQRDAILERLRTGQTLIVCNVQIWTEGVDVPAVNCVTLARPTESLGMFLQMVGRGMRRDGDQEYCVILDHAGCVHRHGLPTEPRHWTLEGRRAGKGKREDTGALVTCEKCGAVRPEIQPFCPVCRGVQSVMFRGLPIEVKGDLVEITSSYKCSKCDSDQIRVDRHGDLQVIIKCRACKETTYEVDKRSAKQASEARRKIEFDRLEWIRRSKGFKTGWVSYRYREIFGTWPPKDWRATDDDVPRPAAVASSTTDDEPPPPDDHDFTDDFGEDPTDASL